MMPVWQRASMQGKFNRTVTLQNDVVISSDTANHAHLRKSAMLNDIGKTRMPI